MNNEEKILSMLDVLLEQVGDLRSGQVNLESKFDKLEERIVRIENRLDKLEHRLDKLEDRFDKLEDRFDKLEDRFDKLEDEVQSLRRTVAKIEVEHGRMLGALSDGYAMLTDKLVDHDNLAKRVESIEFQISAINMKLASL